MLTLTDNPTLVVAENHGICSSRRDHGERAGRVLGVAGILLSLCGIAAPLHAAETPLSLTTTPATIPLCRVGQATRALVALHNTADKPITQVCLKALTNGPVSVDFTGAGMAHNGAPSASAGNNTQDCLGGIRFADLSSNSTVSRPIALNLTDIPLTTPQVVLWADYQTQLQDKKVNSSAQFSLNITQTSAPTPDSIVVTTATSGTSMQENDTGNVLVTIQNKTNEALSFSGVTTLWPSHTSLKQRGNTTLTVAPQSTAALSYEITVDKKLIPGKYLGLIELTAQTNCGIPIHRVVSYEVTLGVFGQSELLTLLNVPSILFLPGYLILSLWLLLWRFKSLRISWLAKVDNAEEFIVGLKDAEFWLLGITMSLLFFVIGPPVLSISNSQPYSLRDIATLWTLSLGVSIGLYSILLGLNRWRLRVAAEELAALTLTTDDSVIAAVEKIHKRQWLLQDCRPVKSKTNITPQIRGFTLWADAVQDSVWVIPQIVIEISHAEMGQLDPAKTDIDSSELLNQLKQIKTKKGARVRWDEVANLAGPCVLKRSDLEDVTGTDMVSVVWQDQD